MFNDTKVTDYYSMAKDASKSSVVQNAIALAIISLLFYMVWRLFKWLVVSVIWDNIIGLVAECKEWYDTPVYPYCDK